MSQASEESRAYNSWNRTPGKPQQNKMSTISSSTDSGVGRTPTWGCDADCGITGVESSVWGNGCVSQATDLTESNKRGSWEESDTQDNCKTGNLSFGFTSQWTVGSGLPTVGSQISTWAMSSTNSVERTSNDTSSIDNCWNLSSRPSDDDYLPRSTSIWSSNAHRRFSDNDSEINTPSTTCAAELHTSIHHKYHSNLTPSSKNNQSIINIENEKSELDDISEAQTWAQAAGKGLQTNGSSEDVVPRREIDEQYETIINRVEGWGSHTVDQSTPWNVVEDVDLSNVVVCPDTIAQGTRSTAESNVWTNEPPNGVGVWESHYEMIGEKTSRWATGSTTSVKPKSSWEVSAESVVSSQWGERDCDSSVWNASSNVITDTRINKPAWISGISQTVKPESAVVGAIGTGSRVNSSNYPPQRNNNALQSSINISSPSGDFTESNTLRQALYPQQNVSMIPSNRSNTNLKVRPTMNHGFRKDDAQCALFNNGMDINRAMNQSSVNQSNLMAQRNDWNTVPDNFRTNPVELDNCMNTGGNSNFMQPPFGGGNSSSIKQQMIQQHMQMTMPGNRTASDNNNLYEKQIIKEISQLLTKQQDLIQRITGLRSIAGSQAIIQEITRTLSEVCQQLNTQQATLKVIKSQVFPNGVNTNNNMQLPRSMPLGQNQSNIMSDLSVHMNDMKLQKRNMDLWPQGNLPSPNTISPFVGMDKSSSNMFYNGPGPNNPINGSMMSQSFNHNNNKPLSQSNFIQSTAHRHSGQMWPSRPSMQGLAHGSQTSIMNNSDYQLSKEDGDYSMIFQTASTAPGELRNTTTALSLSQAPFPCSGNGASTAFTSRDISFASANISEFVPGQPWPGISYSQRDDPNVTLGAGQRSLLSVTNDHLEKLANSNVNSIMTSSDVCANSNILNRLPSNTNGLSSSPSITYVLIRDLPSHINIEMLRNVLTPQSFPGLIQMHPNLPGRWVLLHFTCNEETLKAFKNLYGKVGVVELVPDQEVNQRLQHNNCASVVPVLPFSGMMDFHNQHNQQQHQQSHYLH